MFEMELAASTMNQTETPMTKTNMDLSELLQKRDQGDLLRSIAETVLQLMMESDVDGLTGAGRHERAEQRTTWRNGYRNGSLDNRLGTLNLKVPKLRQWPDYGETQKAWEAELVEPIRLSFETLTQFVEMNTIVLSSYAPQDICQIICEQLDSVAPGSKAVAGIINPSPKAIGAESLPFSSRFMAE
jgi:hypothetical protein